MPRSIYDLTYINNKGQEIAMSQLKGKVLLIVNTASKCGFTPQYKGLEALYQEYKDDGLEIIGFPCDQFGGQEPGNDSEIEQFCELNFGVSFNLSTKIDVNGANTHPIFKILKSDAPGIFGSEKIKWNFTKFLVSKDGQVITRYATATKPESLKADIDAALKK